MKACQKCLSICPQDEWQHGKYCDSCYTELSKKKQCLLFENYSYKIFVDSFKLSPRLYIESKEKKKIVSKKLCELYGLLYNEAKNYEKHKK